MQASRASSPTLLLSFDVEDWAQLVGEKLARPGWDAPGPSFERQMRCVFDLLDATRSKATFFLLGMTVRNYPDVAREMARRGDEIACHGFGHRLVHTLDRDAFRRDVETSIELIDKLTGQRPRGYRAPAFSVTRRTVWALETVAEFGFEYDSSLHDTPRVRERIRGVPGEPCVIRLPSGRELVEVPLATWRRGNTVVPVGGGSYWRFVPADVLARALTDLGRTNPYPACYFHPYECDPEYLRAEVPRAPTWKQRGLAAYYDLRYRFGQKQLLPRIRAVIGRFPTSTYEQAIRTIRERDGARPRALSESGVFV